MNYLQKKKLAFMSIVNSVKGFVRTVIGALPLTLEGCVDENSIIDYKIYGQSAQLSYIPLTYIESTGTQYIDTGVVANENIGFEIEFLTKNSITSDSSKYGCIFGARTKSNANEYQLTSFRSDNTADYKGTFRFGTVSYDGGIVAGAKSTISLKNGKYTKHDGSEVTLEGDFTSPCTITIFALNNNGTTTQHGSLQLFSFKLYDGDTLLRDFIPCYRTADGTIGLYDLVENKFYQNDGTDIFKRGDIVSLDNPIGDIVSPANPIEVVSVGEKTKNLIKYPYGDTSKTLNGLTFIDNGDGTVTVNGVAEANTAFNVCTKNTSIWDGITPNEMYTASVDVDGEYTGNISYVCNYYPEGSSSYAGWMSSAVNKPATKACPTNIAGIRSYIYIYAGTMLDNVTIKPQLEKGETATPYEPYGKYKIPVIVSGKNLCPNDWEQGFINIDTGINQSSNYYIRTKDYFILDKNRVYYISSDDFTDTMTVSWYFYDENKEFIRRTVSKKNRKIGVDVPIPSNASFYRLTINQNEIDTNVKVQIEEGEVATPYEPYHEPITTNIYLDEPLRKVGDYVDYIDFERGKVIRNIKKVMLDGSENWKEGGSTGSFYRYYCTLLGSVSSRLEMCSHFKLLFNYLNDSAHFYLSEHLYLFSDISTREDFIEWLSNNNVTVCYALAEPTETLVTLPTIPIFKGTSIISADTVIQPSNAEIEYYSNVKE